MRSRRIDVMDCVTGNSYTGTYGISGTSALKSEDIPMQYHKRSRVPDFEHASFYIVKSNGDVSYGHSAREDRQYSSSRTRRTSSKQPTRASVSPRNNRRSSASSRQNRKQRRFLHSLRMLLFGLLLGIIVTLGAGMITRASSSADPAAQKYYDNIVISYSQTIEDIVNEYRDPVYYETKKDFIEELCMINGLEQDASGRPVIHPGIHLIIPYYKN